MQSYTISPTKFVYGGDTLGRLPDGRAVFVPFTIPGEAAHIRLVQEKKRHAIGELVEVQTPSELRIAPRCPHFTECGGCHYQHIPYEAQLTVKSEILRDQLTRIAKIDDPPLQTIVPSAEPWFYRNHVQFHLDENASLGFNKARSNEVLPITECYLPAVGINDVWPNIQFEAAAGIDRVGLRCGSDIDIQLILESENLLAPEISVEDLPISVVHTSPAGNLVLAGSETITYDVLGQEFRVSAGSFFQVNKKVAEKMVQHVLESVPLNNQETVFDVYSGVGLFSKFIAPHVNRLVGFEESLAACDDFIFNLHEFDHVELYQARAEDTLKSIETRPDIVILDPPRSGLHKKVIDYLGEIKVNHLVYVSCDPATLARDAGRLIQKGYQLEQITPFDLFPQTYHLESVGIWR